MSSTYHLPVTGTSRTQKEITKPSPLVALPAELVELISTFLDTNSILCLSRASRAFSALPALYIWEHLNLRLPRHYGVHPLIMPFAQPEKTGPKEAENPFYRWAVDEAGCAEGRHRQALKGMTDAVLRCAAADQAAWKRVRRLTVDPRPGSVEGIIEILKSVAGDLVELNLDGRPWLAFHDEWQPNHVDTLDVRLLLSTIQLRAVTHLRISEGAIHFPRSLPFLCGLIPNLTVLDIHLNPYAVEDPDDAPSFPALSGPTRITRMHVRYDGKEELGEEDEEEAQDQEVISALLEIFSCSPFLERLSLDVVVCVALMEDLMIGVSELEKLLDFSCGCHPSYLLPELENHKLRRLVLPTMASISLLSELPSLPFVEAIYLHTPEEDDNQQPDYTGPGTDVMQHMLPQLAEVIRNSPHLSHIRTLWDDDPDEPYSLAGLDVFDRIDELDTRLETSSIRVFRHGDEQLSVVYLLHDLNEISDTPSPERGDDELLPRYIVEYTALDGSSRERQFAQLAEHTGSYYSDFEGMTVPEEIIRQIQVTERIDKDCRGCWNGRSLEVGDEAWAVLTDWRDRVLGPMIVEV